MKQGIDRELAKRLVKELKDSKLKLQVSIQGDELRVSGKKRDDLQEAIAHIRGLKIAQPLQFVNFRDRAAPRSVGPGRIEPNEHVPIGGKVGVLPGARALHVRCCRIDAECWQHHVQEVDEIAQAVRPGHF